MQHDAMMNAAIYTEYGPPEVLHSAEAPRPVPAENEVLVKVYATSVNVGDLMARNFKAISPGQFTMPAPLWLPTRIMFGVSKPKRQILGSEFAGVVAAVGEDVNEFQVGDPVFGYRGPRFGAYAEYLTMAADGLVAPKPANVSFAEAAALSYGPLTALSLLRKVEIRPGDKVLINGASGSIGAAALQLAKQAGAHVTAVCGTPRLAQVRALGADDVSDYTQEDFTHNGERYNLIVDILGKRTFDEVRESLTPHGRYLLVSFKSKQLWQMLRTARSSDQKVICALSSESPQDLQTIKAMIEAGSIRAIVDRTFPLAEAAAAHRYVESGSKQGSVILVVAGAEELGAMAAENIRQTP